MKTNYCTLSPDKVFGIYIGDICKKHDNEYRKDPKTMTRINVDRLFHLRLKERLNKTFIPKVYYYCVRLFCGPSWQRWKYYWLFGYIPIPRIKK